MIEKIPYVKTELELLPVKSEVLQSGQLNDEGLMMKWSDVCTP